MSELPTAEETMAILDGGEPEKLEEPLFAAVMDVLHRHVYLAEPWHYVVVALFVFQGHVARSLPGVFYLFAGGRYGRGKTTLLSLLQQLTGGILMENASIPALARTMGGARTLCLDEIDVSRGRDFDEVRDALLRQGYRADAAPYARWNVATRDLEEVPIYGPKAATFRGTLEEALQSRGFILPTAKAIGEEGYDLVLANLWRKLDALPDRLRAWGEETEKEYPADRVRELAYTDAFRAKVKRAALEIGANRESELLTYALLVAEMLGVDVVEELRKATALAQTLVGEASSDLVEELHDVLLDLAGMLQAKLTEDAPEVRLIQKDVKDELNRRRKERNERSLDNRAFAQLRREAGVEDSWLRKHGNRFVWVLPQDFLTLPNIPTLPTVSDEPGQGVLDGRYGSHGSLGGPVRALIEEEIHEVLRVDPRIVPKFLSERVLDNLRSGMVPRVAFEEIHGVALEMHEARGGGRK